MVKKKATGKTDYHVDDDDIKLFPLVQGLKVAHLGSSEEQQLQDEQPENGYRESSGEEVEPNSLSTLIISDSKSCSACGVVQFSELENQREHFKLDWHRFNLKQRLQGLARVSEEKFEEMVQQEEDNISLSGSDTEIEDNEEEDSSSQIRNRHPWCFFQNAEGQILSVYKCLLANPKDLNELENAAQVALFQRVLKKNLNMAVFMLGGGHFAGAVFRGKDVIVHKTFHCYTVRAKQGGSQSFADNKSGGSHPKSAGASLRRYNEAALVQHVQDIVKLWSSQLNECDVIFYRAASGNRTVLFGGKEPPLSKNDVRLRSIPFPTKRATFNEVKRIHDTLTTIRVHENSEEMHQTLLDETKESLRPKKKSPRKNPNIRRSKSREEVVGPLPEMVRDLAEEVGPVSSDDDENDILSFSDKVSSTGHLAEFGNTPVLKKGKKKSKKNGDKTYKEPEAENEINNKLVTACKAGDIRLLNESIALFQEHYEGKISVPTFLNSQFGSQQLTPLHLAAADGHKNLIKFLMESGADPSVKDKTKRVPYNFCPDKETRNAFRNFQKSYPDRYDYKLSQIPPPLSEESEQKQKEKKMAQKLARKEKEKQKKEEELAKRKEEEEKNRYLNLSDREKRALAAERRILAQREEAGSLKPVLLRCFQCAGDITGKIPFEYEVYKFCSPKCVREHRLKGKN